MVQFAKSEHFYAQQQYERECALANDAARRDTSWRDQIVDDLVSGGQDAINQYEETLNKQRKRARCLADYDGVSIGFILLNKAKERLSH